ncbi:MAG TPA: NAD(P)H-dependent oxidoreductase [Gemmatimonadaceae bacterium]|jgi:NAD(P)H-dependent FMN reductase
MPTLQTIVASTRQGRQGHKVASWFVEIAKAHGKFDVETVDLADVNLPMFDEPKHPRLREYQHDHTKQWSALIERADAYVVVTPEYDHSPPASLLNAFQHLVQEWAYKPIGFVSYGGVSAGTRSMQASKLTAVALKMMPMLESVSIPFFNQLIDKESGEFKPGKVQDDAAVVMLNEMLRWSAALETLRTK